MTARHLILAGLAHLLIAFGLLFAGLSLLDALEPPPLAMPLLIRSDFQQCVTIRNGPVGRPDRLPFQRQKDNA